MALAAVVLARIIGKQEHRSFIVVASRSIGHDLITSTNSSHLVRLGPDLTSKLGELLTATTRVSSVLLGDAPAPFGDGTACSRLVLTNEAGRSLAIRLRQADDRGKFHVLGFQTVTP